MTLARINFQGAAVLFAVMLLCTGLMLLIDDVSKSVVLLVMAIITGVLSVAAFCLGMSHAEQGK